MVFRVWFSHKILHVKQIGSLKFQGHQDPACSQLPSPLRILRAWSQTTVLKAAMNQEF